MGRGEGGWGACIKLSASKFHIISLYLLVEGGRGAVVDDGRVSSIDKRRGASLAEDHLNNVEKN